MFCPRCGQQQVVEDVRFCPRCGFTLGFVAELLANNGVLPAYRARAGAPALEPSPKRRGVRQGGMMMLFGVALIPILGIVGSRTVGVGGEAALLGVILFILGIARLLYGAIFEESHPAALPAALPQQQQAAPAFQSAQPRASLPHHQPPAPVSFRRRDTAELAAPPPSITENTTRLLDDQSDTTSR